MKRNLFCVVIIFFTLLVSAQSKKFKITGTVIAEEDQSPLEAATVYMQRVKDSALVTYTITDKNGVFKLEDQTNDQHLNLFISYVGYKTYFRKLKMDIEEINLEIIPLEVSSSALDEIVIKSEAPVTIKKDTLEFNVKSFKTKKNANVEDLLKQLPGVEIDEEGKIKVNGKEVNKILVNGKPFFGNDPSITTKNLTKDIIEKIQVVDTKTKSEAFTGESGNKENKTINLTIKEENNKGVFGRLSTGGGTNKRYELAGMVNVFDNDRRVSVLAGSNNTNSPGFSFGEISKMFGRGGGVSFNNNGSFSIGGRSFGGGQGITKSQNVGANYTDKIGESTDVSGDYFYASSNSFNENASQRETILSDSRFFTNSNSVSDNNTDNHNINLEFEIETDSTFQINTTPSFTYSETSTRYNSKEETLNENRLLTNESSVNSNVERIAKAASNTLSVTKRIGEKGSFLRFEMENRIGSEESNDFLTSNTEIFGNNPEIINRNQLTEGDNENNRIKSNVTYRLPLISKKLFLNFEYEYSRDEDENTESTFDFNALSQTFSDFNIELSTDFNYIDFQSVPGIGISYKGEKWSTRFKIDYNIRTLKNEDLLRSQFNVARDFETLQLSYYTNYRFSKKAIIYFNYNLRNDPPALRQLQAFSDVSNPLNTIIGNPNLEPSNNHNMYVGFNNYDWQKRTGLYFYLNGSIDNNQVVSKSVIDSETLKRITTYENVTGNYNFGLSGSYSKRVKIDSLRNVKLKLGAESRLNRNINFNNDVQYSSRVSSITPNVGVDFVWEKAFEFKPYYRIAFTNNAYDIEAFEDRSFTRHSAGIRTATFLPEKLEWRNDISYNYNPDVASGFQRSAWFWNSTLTYSVFKDKSAITLKVYDLLNQNTNARRIATQDYIQDSQSTVLQQYFMLSFSWKFNSLGSKGKTNDDGVFFYH